VRERAWSGIFVIAAGTLAALIARSPERQASPATPATLSAESDRARESAGLAIPVSGVAAAELTSQFSERRSGGRLHQAIDILAPRGTPVLAADNGTIARLATNELGGLTIYQFDERRERVYYYAHLARYATGLAHGEPVRRGQVIGFVGTSGNAPEHVPHLHFAVLALGRDDRWWEGTPLDPYELLVAPTRVASVKSEPPRR
jgi:peptidoglycan LD-endopeptidase LytH